MLYISDWDTGEVSRVDASTGEQTTLISGLEEPLGVLFTPVTAPFPSIGRQFAFAILIKAYSHQR